MSQMSYRPVPPRRWSRSPRRMLRPVRLSIENCGKGEWLWSLKARWVQGRDLKLLL